MSQSMLIIIFIKHNFNKIQEYTYMLPIIMLKFTSIEFRNGQSTPERKIRILSSHYKSYKEIWVILT